MIGLFSDVGVRNMLLSVVSFVATLETISFSLLLASLVCIVSYQVSPAISSIPFIAHSLCLLSKV